MKTVEKPLVTILLATYNGEDYLSEQLDSILNQSYDHWSLLISDDGSTDQTPDILAEYQNKYPDKLILLDSGQTFGSACGNFFRLIKNSDGIYVMFCDQDDIWHKDKISITLSKMIEIEEENRPALVFTDLQVVDEDMQQIAPSFIRFSKLDSNRNALHQLLIQNMVTGCTVMANNCLIQMAQEVQDTKDILMHDWWMALIAAAFGEIGFIDKPTVKYRQHDQNAIGATNTRKPSYIIKKVFSNNDLHESLRKTTLQANSFFEMYGDRLSAHDRALVKKYAQLYSKGKLSRLRFMCENKIFKYGIMRKFAQMIWG